MFIDALQAPILPSVAMEPNVPVPNSVGVTPVGGVARTVEANTEMPTTTTKEARTILELISPPFRMSLRGVPLRL
jgi:hypothetical protein